MRIVALQISHGAIDMQSQSEQAIRRDKTSRFEVGQLQVTADDREYFEC